MVAGAAALIGASIGITNIFAIFHEMAHVAVGNNNGVNTKITSWTTVEWDRWDTRTILAGWYFNLITPAVVGLGAAVIGRAGKKTYLTGGAALGFSFVSWVRGFNSFDFTNSLWQMVQTFVSDPVEQQKTYAMLRQSVIGSWIWVGIITLCILGAVVAMCAAGPNSPKPATSYP